MMDDDRGRYDGDLEKAYRALFDLDGLLARLGYGSHYEINHRAGLRHICSGELSADEYVRREAAKAGCGIPFDEAPPALPFGGTSSKRNDAVAASVAAAYASLYVSPDGPTWDADGLEAVHGALFGRLFPGSGKLRTRDLPDAGCPGADVRAGVEIAIEDYRNGVRSWFPWYYEAKPAGERLAGLVPFEYGSNEAVAAFFALGLRRHGCFDRR